MKKLKTLLANPMTYCRLLYAVAFFHLLMASLHAQETINWWLPSNMPAEFTSRQIVAELWTVGLLILGTLELGFTFFISVLVKTLQAITKETE